MSSFYTPRLGLQPETREQMLMRIYERLRTEGIFTENYNTFLGSNWHRFLSASVLPMMEEQQASFFEAQAKLFTFWSDHHMAISGGMGASYEGILNLFRPYCTGLNIVNFNQDKNLGSAGNMSLYFDNLTLHGVPEKLSQLTALFRRAMPIAIFTPIGEHQIDVDFTGANNKSYKYFNLSPDKYDKIDIRIRVLYKIGTVAYPSETISESVRAQFEATNTIGRGFYPTAYFDHQRLPNISSMVIEWSLANTTSWSSAHLPAQFGQKYVINNAMVVQ